MKKRKLGYKKSSFSQIMTGRVPLSDRFLDKLCGLDNLNKVWIKTGKGDMNDADVSLSAITSATTGIPYYNVDFHLGFSLLANDQTLNPEYLIDFPPCNNCDCWVNAHGDSMYPTINGGDIVALRR